MVRSKTFSGWLGSLCCSLGHCVTTLKLTSLTLKTALDQELVRGWLGASLVSSGELESTKLELTGVLLNKTKSNKKGYSAFQSSPPYSHKNLTMSK